MTTKGFKMGKYRALRKLKCLLRIKTALVVAHCPIVARIDPITFELACRIATASGIEALAPGRRGSVISPQPDTS